MSYAQLTTTQKLLHNKIEQHYIQHTKITTKDLIIVLGTLIQKHKKK